MLTSLQAGFKLFYFARNNRFGSLGFMAAIGDVAAHGLLEVVDVVGKDAVELGHFRRDVARNGDVDEEHGPILAAGEELFAMFAAEDGLRRSGRSDDDVGAVAALVEVVELNGLAVEAVRESNCPVIRPI